MVFTRTPSRADIIHAGCWAHVRRKFKEFLDDLNPLPESLLGKAHKYALNQWDHLLVFLEAPHVPIDNNRIENDIRPFVLGRKNWLF